MLGTWSSIKYQLGSCTVDQAGVSSRLFQARFLVTTLEVCILSLLTAWLVIPRTERGKIGRAHV